VVDAEMRVPVLAICMLFGMYYCGHV